MIDNQILNYKIIRKIGEGGMAKVYEAIHTKLDTRVAIKVLDPVLASNENIRKRFMQEAKIMASLNHEEITKVLDFDDKDTHLAIVMEYLDGQTLDDYINLKGALNEEEAKQIFTEVLMAFQYAHDKNIVHRDVKPSNIIITTKGKVKIMDFGIAKIVEDGAKVLTQTGTQMGTPVYMSPEQINDSKHTDHRTDIYSLGVTLWFMLTGKSPYDVTKDSSFQIFKKIDSEPLPELYKHSELDAIIQIATQKDKNKRFTNCDEFAKQLKHKIESEKTIVEEKTLPALKPEQAIIEQSGSIVETEEIIIAQDSKNKIRLFGVRFKTANIFAISVSLIFIVIAILEVLFLGGLWYNNMNFYRSISSIAFNVLLISLFTYSIKINKEKLTEKSILIFWYAISFFMMLFLFRMSVFFGFWIFAHEEATGGMWGGLFIVFSGIYLVIKRHGKLNFALSFFYIINMLLGLFLTLVGMKIIWF